MFYSLIMALIMLALGIVSFWGRNQDSFDGIYATAPLTSAFKRSLGYYSVASILFTVLQMQEEMQLTVLFGHYHVWRLFTYPVMVLLPFLLIMTINAQLEHPKQAYTNAAFALSMLDLAYVLWRYWGKGKDAADRRLAGGKLCCFPALPDQRERVRGCLAGSQ
jgi:hypothetical protein